MSSENDPYASKPGVVGSSPAGRARFPLKPEGAVGANRSDSESSSPDSVPANTRANKTNAGSALNARARQLELTRQALDRQIQQTKIEAPRPVEPKKVPPKSWHEQAIDLWCVKRGGKRRLFRAGVMKKMRELAGEAEALEDGEIYDPLEGLRDLLGTIIPDAWLWRTAPPESWAEEQLVVCEVWDNSPLTKEKCCVLGDLFWRLDEFMVELVVEVVDRTEAIRTVDIYDIAYQNGAEQLWDKWERVAWVGQPEALRAEACR